MMDVGFRGGGARAICFATTEQFRKYFSVWRCCQAAMLSRAAESVDADYNEKLESYKFWMETKTLLLDHAFLTDPSPCDSFEDKTWLTSWFDALQAEVDRIAEEEGRIKNALGMSLSTDSREHRVTWHCPYCYSAILASPPVLFQFDFRSIASAHI
jgi:hypothetical protein